MSQENCFDNITNYANTGNGIELPNALTAAYTYNFCADSSVLRLFDMTVLQTGESVTQLDAKITDKDGNDVSLSAGTPSVSINVGSLNLDGSLRIDYTITTSEGRTNSAPAVFFDPRNDFETLGTSDPNLVPLREKTMEGGVFGCVLCHEHFEPVAVTTWNIAHGTGVLLASSFELYNAANQRMFTSYTPVDNNNLTVTFGSAKAGTAKMTFLKP